MTIFYLIRHAHADWTPDEQRPLSPRGLRDAHRLAEVLDDRPISRIYASPFLRARQTVAPLAERLGLGIEVVEDLRERRLNDGTQVDDFLAAARRTWCDPSLAHPGGESNAAAQARGCSQLRCLARRHRDEHIVVSTHGTLLALILQCYRPGIDYGFWEKLTMPDAYELHLEHERALLRRLWPAGE